MKVSVVIPAHNEEKYIRQCLESLMVQIEPADEIIVVDNNSTDTTVEICKEFPVRIIREGKQGIIHARNTGFNSSKYEIIARCDADSFVPPDWIKKIKEKFKDQNIHGLTGPTIYYDLPFKSTLFAKAYIHAIKKWKKHITFIGPNMALTKKMWEEIRDEASLDDSRVHEDADLAYIAYKKGKVVVYDPLLVTHQSSRRIRKNPQSFFIEYPIRLAKTFKNH